MLATNRPSWTSRAFDSRLLLQELLLRAWMAMPMVLPMAAQVPEYYRSVDRLTWVVDDVDRVTGAWEKFGLARIERRQNLELAVTFRGKPANAKVKMVSGFLGDVRVDWIQPLGGTNAFAEYRKKHGSGVLSLMHRLPGAVAFEQEIERCAAPA